MDVDPPSPRRMWRCDAPADSREAAVVCEMTLNQSLGPPDPRGPGNRLRCHHDFTNDSPSRPSRYVAVLASSLFAAAFALANIPGNVVLRPDVLHDDKYLPPFHFKGLLVHGWPFVFLEHHGCPASGGNGPSAWRIGGICKMRPTILCANFALLILGTLGTYRFGHRHIQQHGCRFGMGALLAVILCVSAVCAFLGHRSRVHSAQVDYLTRVPRTGFLPYEEWQPFGPMWLRRLTGPRFWSWGDTLVSADLGSYEEVDLLPGKGSIQVLRIRSSHSDAMPSLEDYKSLIAIELMPADDRRDSNSAPDSLPFLREVAQCRSLQGLYLAGGRVTNPGIELLSRLPNVKRLVLSCNPDITDDGLAHLESARSLQSVDLGETAVTRKGVQRLRRALPHCEIRWYERSGGVRSPFGQLTLPSQRCPDPARPAQKNERTEAASPDAPPWSATPRGAQSRPMLA